MFNHSWHPLTGEIPEYFKCKKFTKQAVLVIEKSRNIWKCSLNDEKFKIAQNIWGYIVSVNKRHETPFSVSVVNPPLVDKATVPQKCREIILKTRNRYGLEVVNVSDSEIAALFAINWAYKVLKDYRGIEVSGLDMNCNRMFLENDIDIAETVLGWALQAQPEVEKPTVVESNIYRNVFRMRGDNWEIRFDGKTIHMDDLLGWRYIRYVMRHTKEQIPVISLQQIVGKNKRSEQDRQRLIGKGKLVEYDDESTSKAKKRTAKEPQNYLGDIFELIEDLEVIGSGAMVETEEEEEIMELSGMEEVTKKLERIREIIKIATGSTGMAIDKYINIITKIIDLGKKKELIEGDGKQEDVNKIQSEIEDLKRQFSDALMKDSSKIRIKSSFKTARNAVSKAIKEAKEKIQKNHPELYDHLNFIRYKRGEGYYIYEPIKDPQWLFD
ncbi:MAG TPA: hypothetical protein ACFYEF_00365 [Candidatus Wunengus sp. YC63]|uniref:hypothetical protein n=1 Tax=unclassified Candidatus Wunengus TaxID=3367695 RepID=UPI00402786FF